MARQEFQPWWVRANRRILRVFFRGLFHVLGRVELNGMKNIPSHNRYVMAFNHVSLVEIPLIAAFWPVPMEIIGADVVWTRAGHNILAVLWSAISVNRTAFDREVFNQVELTFLAGRPLMISPEGTRSHDPGLLRGKPGVAYIIDKADAEVVPIGVVGNTIEFLHQGLRLQRPTIQMNVGEPFRLPPLTGKGSDRRAKRQANTDYIMAKIASLLPENYRGVYQEYEKILAGEPVNLD